MVKTWSSDFRFFSTVISTFSECCHSLFAEQVIFNKYKSQIFFLYVIFKILRQDEDSEPSHEFEIVQECLVMMLTHYEIHKRPQLLWEWLKSLICVAQKHGADPFYEILTSFGETHSHPILRALVSEQQTDLESKQLCEQLIEFLLQCSEQEGRYPTEERRSCIPHGFWYVLQDDVVILEGYKESNIMNILKPIYARLTQALLKKSELPSTPQEAGTPEDRELFRCYRYLN